MIRKYLSSETGQTSVLLALAFIVLLGFTALAVDGGMVYANRRHLQNASDASSLAGGSAVALYLENHYVIYDDWNCSDPRVLAAQSNGTDGGKITAVKSASINGYAIDYDVSDGNGVDTDCIQGYDNNAWIEKYIDVKTYVTADSPTAFAHLLYSGPLRNSVEAVTRVRPRMPLAYGNAIVSLGKNCDLEGIEFDGTNDVQVTGGGIFSSSCIDTRGGVSVHVFGGERISCKLADCYDDHGVSGSVSPPPKENVARSLPKESYEVDPPNCGGVPARGSYDGSGTLLPGRYDRIRVQNGEHELKPGLYCVANEFTINGGTVAGSSVTIYMQNGDFNTSGNATTSLAAPPARNCGEPCDLWEAIPGVLIYLAEGNAGVASLLGTEDSDFLGLVYAPDGTIEAGGTSSLLSKIHAQLIAKDVKIHGTTTLEINFNDRLNYQIPASLDLNK
jgi:hypothetical protein